MLVNKFFYLDLLLFLCFFLLGFVFANFLGSGHGGLFVLSEIDDLTAAVNRLEMCKGYEVSVDKRLNGVYFPSEDYYCVYVKDRLLSDVELTDRHEYCHYLVDVNPAHFCGKWFNPSFEGLFLELGVGGVVGDVVFLRNLSVRDSLSQFSDSGLRFGIS